jgi:predicted transcriptional regulator
MALRDIVLETVQKNPSKSISQLSEMLGKDRKLIRTTLAELQERHVIVSVKNDNQVVCYSATSKEGGVTTRDMICGRWIDAAAKVRL